jgi:hypothetical protein
MTTTPKIPVKPRIAGGVYWVGSNPTKCDCCQRPIDRVFIDGRTQSGPWAMLRPDCHNRLGVGLGLGKGQRYEQQEDGQWLKTEG